MTATEGPRPRRAEYDAALHLLDRQIIDVEGRLVGKVDDIELTTADGKVVLTGLMVGLGALLPRLGRRVGPWLEDRYRQVSVSHARRRLPSVVDLDLIDHVDSAVHLREVREGLLEPRIGSPAVGVRRRLGDLCGMPVYRGGSTAAEDVRWPRHPCVIDIRFAEESESPGTYVVAALMVGSGRAGTFLGYDRAQVDAPWPVAAIVRTLHSRSLLLTWGSEIEIDWDEGTVRLGKEAEMQPLTGRAARRGRRVRTRGRAAP